jgi:hypothetical protein
LKIWFTFDRQVAEQLATTSGGFLGRHSTTNGGRDMGIHDRGIVQQAKKGQGETNQRLDALIAEQRRTNELLEAMLTTLGNWLARSS